MDILKISSEAGKILKYLSSTDLKPDEKIAALRSTASTIEHVLGCEMFAITMSNILKSQKKKALKGHNYEVMLCGELW